MLVLDEPTNDLDIDTLELLEELLTDYDGTVFLVSHDRTFLDNVVTQVIASEGDGLWREYVGGYTDWERYQRTLSQQQADKAAAPKQEKAAAKPAEDNKAAGARKKLSYKEQRELDELPALIAKLEAEQADITAQLNDADLYKNGPDRANQLHSRYAELDEQLLNALERWEAIESKQN
ncbi:hypothetical protein [Undibacterium luofuense]|uniref:hypothetical protein n=1 Tax=Undibacterium luofuense TaxID=2828733 RepID=UPI003F69AF81